MSEIKEIIGNATTTPVPQSDWNQTDATKADYIKNKPVFKDGAPIYFYNGVFGEGVGPDDTIEIKDIDNLEDRAIQKGDLVIDKAGTIAVVTIVGPDYVVYEKKVSIGDGDDSSVYVGYDEPPASSNANVWIDLEGDYGKVEEWKFTDLDGVEHRKNIIIPHNKALIGFKVKQPDGSWAEVPALVGKDGEDGISIKHAWNGTELILQSASGITYTELKGDRGERGEKGDKGDKGDPGNDGTSGVYIGSEEPPADTNANVWIDIGDEHDYGYIEEWEFTKENSNEPIYKRIIVPPEKAIVGLNLKQQDGSWAAVPALIGQDGATGPQGEQGPQGDRGDDSLVCNQVFSYQYTSGKTVAVTNTWFNRTPKLGDIFHVVCAGAYYTIFEITSVGETSCIATAKTSTNIKGNKGDTGDKGDKGDKGDQGIQGEPGTDGKDGEPGVHIGPATDTPPDSALIWIETSGEYGQVEKWKFVDLDGNDFYKNIIVPDDGSLIGLRIRQPDGSWAEIPALVGRDGVDGKDGESVQHFVNNGTTLTIVTASGQDTLNVKGDKGDKGDTGSQGPQGERGYSGVHVGSDYPPAGTNVWIDIGNDYGSIEEWEFTKEGSSDTITKRVIVPPEKALVGLKILQPDGVSWAEVPALVGEKGDKGDKGDTGSDASVTSANIAAALGYTPADKTKYLPLSGGTMTGPITIGQGTGMGIELGEAGEIKTGANTVLGMDTPNGAVKIGSSGHVCKIRGYGSRPTYNGSEMALKADIPTTTPETWRFTLEDGTVVEKVVHIG